MFNVGKLPQQVASEHFVHLFHQSQPAAGALSKPVSEKFLRGASVALLPKAPEGFFQPPNFSGARVQVVELPEGELQPENRKVTHPGVIVAFKGFSDRAGRFVMLGLPHSVSRYVR